MSKRKKSLIIIGSIFLTCIIMFVAFLGGYFLYVLDSYERIEDNYNQEIIQNSEINTVEQNTELSIVSYNIGFGAYSQDYSFFLDKSVTKDGKKNTGDSGCAKSKAEVLFNTNGAINVLDKLNPDFILLQEVDLNSTRSFHVNQYEMINTYFTDYDSTFALNFHTAFLPYPLHDMHGESNAGLASLSKYKMNSAVRRQLPIADDLSKLFDLDRCFSVMEYKVSTDKTLVIVNIHMSAYDEGGVIRNAQLDILNSFLESVNDENHYVIIGGDFNHDLVTFNPKYGFNNENIAFSEYKAFQTPDWLAYMFNEDETSRIMNPFIINASTNAPTNRDASVAWEKGATFASTIDGFITSSNIEVVSIETIITSNGNKGIDHFAYSDHDPVLMKFILK